MAMRTSHQYAINYDKSKQRLVPTVTHKLKTHSGVTFDVYQNAIVSNDSSYLAPVTVAERSKACTVFTRSEAGIVGSNPTQGTDVCL
ncbi:hypothetical protein B7P43_G06288 [Cryptotermes secundus]|uniref:Uncharacterized protein n=1 Tax=Cryptotermes secundus TaxID=105785 RepID=A0A2J7PVX6_9NEOP|nr:hypothetical protein B7P43_G06288 [Cryptotermes secundus]